MAVKMAGQKVLKCGLAAVLVYQRGVGNLARNLLFGLAEIRNGKSEKI
jgi:hypothetical protein